MVCAAQASDHLARLLFQGILAVGAGMMLACLYEVAFVAWVEPWLWPFSSTDDAQEAVAELTRPQMARRIVDGPDDAP